MNYSNQLKSILKAAGWSQERLARELEVSFPALNAWINGHAEPRKHARLKIEKLHIDIVGAIAVSDEELRTSKIAARNLKASARKLAQDQKALDKLILHLTYHTNTIEGSTMTLSDVEEVIFENKVLSNRTAIEQTEARNHQAAFLWLLEQLTERGSKFCIDENLILGLHLRLMNGIRSDAGQYRRQPVRIMGAHVPLANWRKVPDLVHRFTESLNGSNDLVRELAVSHAWFEQIHPFSDGNGRTGRLLMLAQALRAGYMPPLITKERKHAYYKYLELAQTKEDYSPLELFIAQSMRFCAGLMEDDGL